MILPLMNIENKVTASALLLFCKLNGAERRRWAQSMMWLLWSYSFLLNHVIDVLISKLVQLFYQLLILIMYIASCDRKL